MNRKYIALTVSLFFASSGAALTMVDSEELSAYSDSALLLDLYNEEEQNDYIKEQEQKKAEQDAALSGSSQYTTDSDVILVETKEDKRKLEEQKKALVSEQRTELTQDLNEDAKRKLEAQLAETGAPPKSNATTEAATAVAASQNLPATDAETAQQDTQVAQNTQPKTFDELRALNLAPPIPPGTLGGGNGNGGPGGGAVTPSFN
ncbi:hypothetical protein [Thalassotalea sp. Y01]|uniref:hypothetical protein n=1 Tax=Thalassotalea sp. Y01 TaxID=2729613 RepID=UPI00145D2023|nr:hypothetical protein [Thalassotalea sp. Y01]NMP16480.1 hypothetical protein [Thalassotalea sp. Y01]